MKLQDCIPCRPIRPVSIGKGVSSPKSQSGAALIVALLIFALCTALIVAMKSDFDLYYQRGANAAISEQIYAYLRGAEELGTLVLKSDYDQDLLRSNQTPQDDLSEIWAQPSPPQSLPEGGWWKGSLQDLQGRFNLNSLNVTPRPQRQGTVGYHAAQQQFIRLLGSIEVPRHDAQLITESIGDWLDTDNQPRPNGAEDDYYSVQTPAYRAANQLMKSVSELRLVAYVTPEIYSALMALGALTVLPEPTTINMHTAPAAVLRTFNEDNNLTPLSESEAAELFAFIRSEQNGPTTVEEVKDHAVFAGKSNMGDLISRMDVSSSYFLLSAEAKVADRTLRLYSVLKRDGRSIEVIGRASGDL